MTILILPHVAIAQKLRFKRISGEDGLQNNIVLSTTQDSKGFMWFATITGIDRYDGNSFVHYKLPSTKLKSNDYVQVNTILSDVKNRVFAASANSIFKLNSQLDKFEIIPELEGKITSNQSILSLLNDKDDNIWIGLNNCLLLFNFETREISTAVNFQLPVRTIFQDKNGVVWIGTNNGLFKIKFNGNRIETESCGIYELSKTVISSLSQDDNGRYWIGTVDKGLFVYNSTNNFITRIRLPQSTSRFFTVKDFLHNEKNDENYVALDGGGLIIVDKNLNITSINQTDDDDPASLSNNGVYDIYKDRYNRIWVTTYGGGVNLINSSVQPFTNFYHVINNSKSLSNNMAKAVTEDSNGNLWFGTRKGISKLNTISNTWEHINQDSRGEDYPTDNVLALINSINGNIWAGTYGGGLVCYNPINKKLKNYTSNLSDSQSIGTDYVYTVYEDSKQRIWSGGIRGPLSMFDQKTNKFKRYNIGANSINCIIETNSKLIAIGSEKGIHLLNSETQISKLINGTLQNKSSIEKVIFLLEYETDKLWIGTQGSGLVIYDLKKELIDKIIKSNDGLPSDIVCGMLKDRNGDVWISTSKGIAHYQIQKNRFVNYTRVDGLAGSQFNYGSCCKTRNGDNLIFGSTNGFSMFNPSSIKAKGFKPEVYFTGISINNKQAVIGEKDCPFEKCLDQTNIITLKYSQNSFSIDFVSPTPSTSGKHLYTWKLEGFDKNWSPLSSTPNAVYTNLNEGKYKFLVKALAKGQQNDLSEVRSINIFIQAPWWRSLWAYLLYSFIISVVAYLWYKNYTIETTRKKFSDRLELQTNIVHEIRTPLTLIKGPLSSLANDHNLPIEDKKNIELARRNIVKLENLVSQFIDYHKLGINKLQMQVANTDIVVLLKETLDSFEPVINEKKITYSYKSSVDSFFILFDKEKMEKIFNNLLSNAVKYTPQGRSISIETSHTAKDFVINISDTGIGIPESQQRFIFNGYYRADNAINLKEVGSGIGLNIVKEMVELHHGSIAFKSTSGKGTSFLLKIPIKNEYLEQFVILNNQTEKYPIIEEKPIIEEHEYSNSNAKILLVEDNDDLRKYLSNELINLGYKVLEADNGKEALVIVKSGGIELIISDLMMPEMNGFELCKKLKKDVYACHIPIILLTAVHDREYILEGFRSGADDYVKKPFDIDFIVARVENLLQNRSIFKQKIMSVFDGSENIDANDGDLELLKKVTDLVVSNFHDSDFTVEKLSKMMTMSRPVLFKKFKALTNQSLQSFINQVRLKKAVEFLKTKKYSISDIAFMVGFEDPKYFSTAFKKHFDKTPTEYLVFIKAQDESQIHI